MRPQPVPSPAQPTCRAEAAQQHAPMTVPAEDAAPAAAAATIEPGEGASYAEPIPEAPAPVQEPAPRPADDLASRPAHPGQQATFELCLFCFQVIRAHLEGQPPPPFPQAADPGYKAPIFVTWYRNKRNGNSGLEMRGCIGCLEPVVLQPGLSEYALRSSMQDKRFSPVKLDEVSSLTCKISILYQFEVCADPYDWEVGVHGILVSFSDAEGKAYSATYLPEVPPENSMTRQTAIRELVTKSGYTGPCDQEFLKSVKVKRYRTLVQSVGYADYVRGLGEATKGLATAAATSSLVGVSSAVVHAT